MNITRRAFLALFIIFQTSYLTIAQVAINADGASPDASAMLDVTSNSKGILIPRMTTSERTNISSPATGLLVYDTDCNSFWYYNNTEWTPINTDIQTLTFENDSLTIIDGNTVDLSELKKIDNNGLTIRGNALGGSTLDVSQTSTNDTYIGAYASQSFKPTVSGYLTEVMIKFYQNDFDGGNFRVYNGTGGVLLAEIAVGSLDAGWQTIDISGEYLSISSGQTYTIYLTDTVDNYFECSVAAHTNPYADGTFHNDSSSDLAFKIYSTTQENTYEYNFLTVNNFSNSSVGINLSNLDALNFSDGSTQTSASYFVNQNIELNDFLISNDGGNEGISIANNGNVTLSDQLTIGNDYTFPSSDGNSSQILVTDGSGTLTWTDLDTNDDLGNHTATQNIELNGNWISNDGGNEGIQITDDGNIGIGTTPTNAKFEVLGSGSTHASYTFGYLNGSGSTGLWTSQAVYSIYTDNKIAGFSFHAHSDERIKDIQGISNSKEDLNTLMDIEITDYTLKDKITNGDNSTKKVIAQQVKSVYPQAVSTNTTQVIPDIFQTATIDENNWVQLATDLKTGEKVQIIFNDKKELLEVLEVKENAFRVKQGTGNGQQATVFIYGRQVTDFHTVDYEAISMLNVSATQQLAKENATLKQKVADLEKQVKKINQLEAKLEALLNQ